MSPHAAASSDLVLTRRRPGVLVECEPAIKSIIVHLDSENHDFIIEDLDEQRLVVKENMVQLLKQKLEDVRSPGATATLLPYQTGLLTLVQRLKETYRPEEPLLDSE